MILRLPDLMMSGASIAAGPPALSSVHSLRDTASVSHSLIIGAHCARKIFAFSSAAGPPVIRTVRDTAAVTNPEQSSVEKIENALTRFKF
jgi:acetaldehyde dehydrogenase (acetylating)